MTTTTTQAIFQPIHCNTVTALLKSVATGNGNVDLHAIQAETIRAVLAVFFDGAQLDLGSIPSKIESYDVLPDPKARHELIRIAAPLTLLEIDGHQQERAKSYRELAKAWGIRDHVVEDAVSITAGHKRGAILHGLHASGAEAGGSLLRQAWGSLMGALHLDGDPKVLARYSSYEKLSPDTLGHTMFRYYRDNEFGLPGTPGSIFSNLLTKHDFHHVLAGYPTSPLGEICVLAFDGGITEVDFSSVILSLIAQFQVGIVMDSTITSWVDQFDPKIFYRAYQRGSRVTTNYIDEAFDFDELASEPLHNVRAKLGIEPEGMMIMDASQPWCGPLGPPGKRSSESLRHQPRHML